ncbi:hypothetical protein ACFQX6_62375 [Streptosporangium lutulentum]
MIWAVMGTPLSTMQATRYMLAWSLDRTVPQKLGEVSERFHTPVKAIALCAVTGEIALIALVNWSDASLLGALLAQILAFIVVALAAWCSRTGCPASGSRRAGSGCSASPPWRWPERAACSPSAR